MCNRPMGLQNRRLKDSQITASSEINDYSRASRARLNIRRQGRLSGGWQAAYNNRYQWIQVFFISPAKIIRIATQGQQDKNQWVTQYVVYHSLNAVSFKPYQERNNIKVSGFLFELFENLGISSKHHSKYSFQGNGVAQELGRRIQCVCAGFRSRSYSWLALFSVIPNPELISTSLTTLCFA